MYRGSFTEQIPPVRAGARVSEPLRDQVTGEVGDQLRPVAQVAGAHALAWHTVHEAFADRAEEAVAGPPQLRYRFHHSITEGSGVHLRRAT